MSRVPQVIRRWDVAKHALSVSRHHGGFGHQITDPAAVVLDILYKAHRYELCAGCAGQCALGVLGHPHGGAGVPLRGAREPSRLPALAFVCCLAAPLSTGVSKLDGRPLQSFRLEVCRRFRRCGTNLGASRSSNIVFRSTSGVSENKLKFFA